MTSSGAEVALEDGLVEDEAEAGTLGWGDVAVLDDDGLDEQVTVERAGVELLEHEVRRAGVELDGSRRRDRADVHVRGDQGVVGVGYGSDLLGLQDAAALAHVDLDDPDGLLLQGVGEIVLGGEALAGGDGDARLGSDAGHLFDHLGRDGLLKPDRVVLLEDLGDADGAGGAELAVGADADFELVADGLTDVAEDAGGVLDVLEGPVA